MILLEMCFGCIPLDLETQFSLTQEEIEHLFFEKNYSQQLIEIITNLLINRRIILSKDVIHVTPKEYRFSNNKKSNKIERIIIKGNY